MIMHKKTRGAASKASVHRAKAMPVKVGDIGRSRGDLGEMTKVLNLSLCPSLSLSLPLALTLTQVGIHPAVRGKVNMGAETRRADLLATLQGFRPGAGVKGALVVSYSYPYP